MGEPPPIIDASHQESAVNFSGTNLLKRQLLALCARNHVHECGANLALTCINFTLVLVVCAFGLVAASLYKKPPVGLLFPFHSLRWNLFMALLLLYTVTTLDSILQMSYEYSRPQHSAHLLLNAGSSLTAMVAVTLFYSHCEEKYLWQGLSVLVVYWPIFTIGQILKALALYEKGAGIQSLCLEYTYASIVLSLSLAALETYVFATQCARSDKNGRHNRLQEPEELNATYRYSLAPLLSQITFAWVLPLLRKGFTRPLTQTDLGYATQEHSNETQSSRFNENLVKEYERLSKSDSKDARINLWRVYVKTYWRQYLFAVFLKICGDILALAGPLSIKKIITFIEDEREGTQDHRILTFFDLLSNGYVLAIAVLVSTLLQSTLSNNFQHIVTMQSIYIQSALRTAIYSKTLSLRLRGEEQEDETEGSEKDKKTQPSIGSIVNHMSTDCAQVMLIFTNLHYIWMLPLKVGLTLYLIYDVLGVSALLSSSFLIAVTPIQYLISKAMSRIQRRTMIISDERIKKTAELIQGVKLLKILGWEKLFIEKIQQIRTFERKLLKRDAVFVAMNTFLTMLSSVLVPLSCFAFYTFLGGSPLEAGVIFEALSLFNHLTLPLFIVPFAIPVVISSMVSTRRLEEFLSKPEIDHETPWSKSMTDFSNGNKAMINYGTADDSFLAVSDGTLEWNKGVEVLRDLNFNVPAERLTLIAGPCGTGKSTLLSALLGELEFATGSIRFNVNSTTPFVAYVPQTPWLVNATVRDNVIFGKPYDQRWYRKVMDACALYADLETLPAADRTEIGERGANLSGGQRQRIAIARAIYSDASFIILDDPLSALDAHVANSVFENAIQKLLVRRNKTVVMVTQKKDILRHAHQLLILNEKVIAAKGTLEEIQRDSPESLELLEGDSVPCPKPPVNRTRIRSKCKASFSESVERNLEKAFTITRRFSEIGQGPFDGCGDKCANESHHPLITERRSSILSERGLQFRCLEGSISPVRSRSQTGASIVTFCEKELSRMGSLEVNDLGNPSVDMGNDATWRLVGGEDRCEGSISKKVYLNYAKACGIFAASLSIGLFALMQVCKMASDFWLTEWSHHNREVSETGLDDTPDSNWYYLLIYAAISFANVIFAFAANLCAQLTTIRATKPLHDKMLERVVECPQSFFDQNPAGRVINRFSADMNIVDRKLPIGSPVLIRFILICLSVVLVNVMVTPLSIIFMAISFAVYWYLQYFFRASSRELQRLECITRSPIVSHFSETLDGLHTIRAFDRQQDFTQKLHKLINDNNIAVIMLNSANCWLGVSLDYMGAVILFLVIMINIVASLTGYITPAAVGLTMTYTLLVPQYLNWVVKNLALVEMYMSSVERIMSYIGLTGEKTLREDAYDPRMDKRDGSWPSQGLVEFENISLKYDTSSQPVLNDVNITIKPGEKVGICGRSGSGKSSLVMGLFQMVPLTRGRILIDGIDLAKEDAHEVRSRLSMIPQDPILFEGSVRYNLDPIGRHTEEELWSALERANIKDIVVESGGLDAEITEGGSNLSSGEKQLFCLARSILSPSRVLVLDEATSSLDVSLEDKMLEIIGDVWRSSTVIAIAHRVTSIENFDRVIVLDNGQIVEVGDPRTLKTDPNSHFGSLLNSYKTQQSKSIN